MKILILGASGLVGGHLYRLALEENRITEVITIGRSLVKEHPKTTQRVGNLENIESFENDFNCDAVFCALGTTIKKTGSKEQFKKVDHDFPLQAAKLLKKQNPKGSFCVVTALGSNPNSLFFYNRVKGELEEHLTKLELHSLNIFRPSIILGDREESRPGEAIGQTLAQWTDPLLKKICPQYAGIEAKKIAMAMLEHGISQKPGKTIVSSKDMKLSLKTYE